MQFNTYKENINKYIDEYYDQLIQEMESRPESSFSVIFEEELSTMKRYCHSLFKEMFFDMQDELEQLVADEQAQEKLDEIQKMIEKISIHPISYQGLLKEEDTSLLMKDNSSKSTNRESVISVYQKPCIFGSVIGAVLGGGIGKSIVMSALGALSGGAIAYTTVHYRLQKKSSLNEKKSVILDVNKPKKVLIAEIIGSRKLQMKQEFISMVDKIEEQFLKL